MFESCRAHHEESPANTGLSFVLGSACEPPLDTYSTPKPSRAVLVARN
jgi:hypothetical protein